MTLNKNRSRMFPVTDVLARIPYWLLCLILLGLIFCWNVVNDENYMVIFKAVIEGVFTTVYVSAVAFVLATSLGLLLGLCRISGNRLVRECSSFYVELIRGIPMLVLLYYIAFVGAPALIGFVNWVVSPLIDRGIMDPVSIRNLNFLWRAILALTIGYSAFISEVFRAGIESIDTGQMEAAKSIGMTRWQAMRHVILPQAVRNVLPPLGNDLVSMIKDSALVSALGVQDITLLGKVYSASTFRFFETYNVVAFLYLIMTISLSLLVRWLEKRMEKFKLR